MNVTDDKAAKAMLQSRKLAIAAATRLAKWANISDADKAALVDLITEAADPMLLSFINIKFTLNQYSLVVEIESPYLTVKGVYEWKAQPNSNREQ